MKIFWIQKTEGGVPEDPEFFGHRSTMLNRWLEIWQKETTNPVNIFGDDLNEGVLEVDYMAQDEGELEWRCGEGEIHDLI